MAESIVWYKNPNSKSTIGIYNTPMKNTKGKAVFPRGQTLHKDFYCDNNNIIHIDDDSYVLSKDVLIKQDKTCPQFPYSDPMNKTFDYSFFFAK